MVVWQALLGTGSHHGMGIAHCQACGHDASLSPCQCALPQLPLPPARRQIDSATIKCSSATVACSPTHTCAQALVPAVARLRVGSGEAWREVPADALSAGDEVVVLPGDPVPVDGTVASGRSSVDESALSGEAMPVTKLPGALLLLEDASVGALCTRSLLGSTSQLQLQRPAQD